MDVSHLIPTPTSASATGAAATRARTERAPFETAELQPDATAAEPRPIAAAVHVADRVERSPELARTLAELGLLLARTPDAPQEQIVALRSAVAGGSLAAGGAFEAAALALLHREPIAAP
jgi:hypothetical protein